MSQKMVQFEGGEKCMLNAKTSCQLMRNCIQALRSDFASLHHPKPEMAWKTHHVATRNCTWLSFGVCISMAQWVGCRSGLFTSLELVQLKCFSIPDREMCTARIKKNYFRVQSTRGIGQLQQLCKRELVWLRRNEKKINANQTCKSKATVRKLKIFRKPSSAQFRGKISSRATFPRLCFSASRLHHCSLKVKCFFLLSMTA